MIDQTFLHLPGVGPKAEAKIQMVGMTRWQDVLQAPHQLPFRPKQPQAFFDMLNACQTAFENDDLEFLVNTLVKKEQWRILATYRDRCSFFDIETNGLDQYADITVIGCYHRGKLHRFVRGENLEAFLDLLEDMELLVSFNGSSFDVPQICKTWRIPDLGVPHIDLRWQCYHQHLRGGLKEIEPALGIDRPRDLSGVDGEAAIWLWDDWDRCGDRTARELLLRYCGADVLALAMLTDALLERLIDHHEPPEPFHMLWQQLDGIP